MYWIMMMDGLIFLWKCVIILFRWFVFIDVLFLVNVIVFLRILFIEMVLKCNVFLMVL